MSSSVERRQRESLGAELHRPMAGFQRHMATFPVTLNPAGRREGVVAWFPCNAEYTADFLREALIGRGVEPGRCSSDPWNGSGTPTAVAGQLGCEARGFDINPVAALVATARVARAADEARLLAVTPARVSVHRVLATINPRAVKHEPIRCYVEDVVAVHGAA